LASDFALLPPGNPLSLSQEELIQHVNQLVNGDIFEIKKIKGFSNYVKSLIVGVETPVVGTGSSEVLTLVVIGAMVKVKNGPGHLADNYHNIQIQPLNLVGHLVMPDSTHIIIVITKDHLALIDQIL
jgi:hypothetical protein